MLREMHEIVPIKVDKDPEELVTEVLRIKKELRECHGVEVDHSTVVHKILKSLPEEYKGANKIIKNELEKDAMASDR